MAGMINLDNESTSKAVSRGSAVQATGSVAPLDLCTPRQCVPFGVLSDICGPCNIQYKPQAP